MKSEKNNIQELRVKMSRFNTWERSYVKQLSEEEKMRQFVELFELGMSCDSATVEKAHREHLEQLARIARTLREKNSLGDNDQHPPQSCRLSSFVKASLHVRALRG